MNSRTIVSVAILAFAAVALAQIPVPSRPDGWRKSGPANAPIVMEFFIDILCPDSKDGDINLRSVVNYYGNNLQLIVHIFPLPYHTWSFIANQGFYVVQKYNASGLWNYYDAMFLNQQTFWNAATADSSSKDVINKMAALVQSQGITSASNFIAGIADQNLNWATRVSWKYGCSRNIAGTPTYLINGVNVMGDPDWKLSDWRKIIDPLLPGAAPVEL